MGEIHAHIPTLITIALLLLPLLWVGYRAERQQDEAHAAHNEARRQLEAGSCLSALHAATQQLKTTATDLAGTAKKRKPEPLPGMQIKPKRQDSEHMRLMKMPIKGSFAPIEPKKRARTAR